MWPWAKPENRCEKPPDQASAASHLFQPIGMSVDSIRAYCLSFPRATENLQWGDDLCFKIGGKIFAIVSLDNPRLCFKCTPETFAELIEREDIHPAPYVG